VQHRGAHAPVGRDGRGGEWVRGGGDKVGVHIFRNVDALTTACSPMLAHHGGSYQQDIGTHREHCGKSLDVVDCTPLILVTVASTVKGHCHHCHCHHHLAPPLMIYDDHHLATTTTKSLTHNHHHPPLTTTHHSPLTTTSPTPPLTTHHSPLTITTTSITLDGDAAAQEFDGHGGLSAGATTRLLADYPPQQQSEVLDYLFLPGFGASLQVLKVCVCVCVCTRHRPATVIVASYTQLAHCSSCKIMSTCTRTPPS
jgi:hypothetical protein